MLYWRLAISAIIIPALCLAFWADTWWGPQSPILLLVVIGLAIRGAGEMTDLLHTRSFTPHRLTVTICSVFVATASWYGRFPHFPIAKPGDDNTLAQVMLAYSLTVLALFLLATYRYREPGRSMETLGVELMIVSYIGVLLGVAAQLRWVAGDEAGYLVIGSLIIVTKAGDIGAYFIGRLFGRAKMVPHLSPGKTWMGAVGALLGSALGALAWMEYATPLFNASWTPIGWPWTILYGVILGVVGLIGDLCESLIKRDVGKKDSARLLPGFGGVLDLLDSVLYSAPVAYMLWKWQPLIDFH